MQQSSTLYLCAFKSHGADQRINMGQAKARGTKEQRVIEGEIRAAEKLAKEKKARQEYLLALTPEQREKIKNNQMLLCAMLAFSDSRQLSSRIGKNF